MDEYNSFSSQSQKEEQSSPRRERGISFVLGIILGIIVLGFISGLAGAVALSQINETEQLVPVPSEEEYTPQTTHEQRIINVVQDAEDSVVSIVISREVQVGGFFTPPRTERQEVGGGSGFIVSEDGLIVTNRHVVQDTDAEYTVFLPDGTSYPATVLARDPLQDLAVLQVDANDNQLAALPLGNSENLQMGQTVVAIGNALGEFQNTISVGVVSGLGRNITASDGTTAESIEDVIQTDAAINRGNSGGPLLNLAGEVIGINTATVVGAQNIGFAIPINDVARSISQVQQGREITYPLLGVEYISINPRIQETDDLPVEYGALVVEGGVRPGSAAAEAGIQSGDIILGIDGERIDREQALSELIRRHEPGDEVSIVVLRDGEELTLSAELGEISS